MDKLASHFCQSHPQQAASLIDTLNKDELIELISELDADSVGILTYVSPMKLVELLSLAPQTMIDFILEAISDRQLSTLLNLMDSESKQSTINHLASERQFRINRMIEYHNNQIGFYVQKPKMVLTENHTVGQLLDALVDVRESDLPAYVIDQDYRLIGTVDTLKLIHARGQTELTIGNVVHRKTRTLSAQSPIESVLEQSFWNGTDGIAIVGQQNQFLGILSKDILKHRAFIHQQPDVSSPADEFIYFSEMLWSGLNKFWGTIK